MPFHSRTARTRDDWQTPAYIVDCLGGFDLDPCANRLAPKRLAKAGLTTGGLDAKWSGRVWLNPPYGTAVKFWIEKLSQHGNGIALIVPRCGSRWFHKFVFQRASGILFLRGRISFLDDYLHPVHGNNADSVLCAYGKKNAQVLAGAAKGKLPGRFF